MIIGISGKLGSGKDLTGKIIQALTNKPQCFDNMDTITEEQINYKVWDKPIFENKKFADVLKDFICMLLGCTREMLENREFKESPLGPEWEKYRIIRKGYRNSYVSTEEEALKLFAKYTNLRYVKVKMTPRLLLQLMGTECGRQILHPNIWVNAVMANYVPIDHISVPNDDRLHGESYTKVIYPDWIITDMRFPNELTSVKEREGITIRVNRESIYRTGRVIVKDEHPSETGLDNAKFDYTISNNGTIKELVDEIREILIKEKLI